MAKPEQGRKILGHDLTDQPRRQNDPDALAAFDADKDDFLRGPSGRKAQSPSAPQAVYYLDMVPGVLERKGFPFAAACMKHWLSRQEFVKTVNDDLKANYRARLLDLESVKKWKQTSKFPLGKLTALRPWLGPKKDEVIARVQERFKTLKAGDIKTFPDVALISNAPALTDKGPLGQFRTPPATEDTQWANEVAFWGLFFQDSASDGAGAVEIGVSGFDDYAFAIGNYDWFFMPRGAVQHLADGSGAPLNVFEVTVSELGIYARDTYDFNGNQGLGVWDVDKDDISLLALRPSWLGGPSDYPKDALYKKSMGDVILGNSSFRRHREVTQRGGDFIMFSDVKFFPITNGGSFRFDAKTGKPI